MTVYRWCVVGAATSAGSAIAATLADPDSGVGLVLIVAAVVWSGAASVWGRPPVALPAGLEVRPRFGTLIHEDGTRVVLVFHPHPRRRSTYVGLSAGDETVPRVRLGDDVKVDAIRAGQRVTIGGRLVAAAG